MDIIGSCDARTLKHPPHCFTERWWINGIHYAKTLRAWLRNMDRHEPAVREVLAKAYATPGPSSAATTARVVDWRLFYMACEELFKYNGGEEWGVVHYLFQKPA